MSTPTELNEEFFRVNLQKGWEPTDEFSRNIAKKEFIEKLPARFAAGQKALDIVKETLGFDKLDSTLQKAIEQMIIDRKIDSIKIEDRPTALLSGIAEVQKAERTKKIDFVLALSNKSDTTILSKKELLEALDIMQDIVDSKILIAHIKQIQVESDPLPANFYATVIKEIKAFGSAYRKHNLEPLDALADTSTAPQATPIPQPPKRYNPPRKAETPKQPESKQSETPANASAQTPAAKTEPSSATPQPTTQARKPPPPARKQQQATTPTPITEVPGYLKPYISPDDNRMTEIYENNVVGQIFLEDINYKISHRKDTVERELATFKTDDAIQIYLTKMSNFDKMPPDLQNSVKNKIANAKLHTIKDSKDRATTFLDTIKQTIEDHKNLKIAQARDDAKLFLSHQFNQTRDNAKKIVEKIGSTWGVSEKETLDRIVKYLNNPTTTDEAAVAFAGQFINNFFSAAVKQGLVTKPPQLFVAHGTTATVTPVTPVTSPVTATLATNTQMPPAASTSTASSTTTQAKKAPPPQARQITAAQTYIQSADNQAILNTINSIKNMVANLEGDDSLKYEPVKQKIFDTVNKDYLRQHPNTHYRSISSTLPYTIDDVRKMLEKIKNALPESERNLFLQQLPEHEWPNLTEDNLSTIAQNDHDKILDILEAFIPKLIRAQEAITKFQTHGAKAWSGVDASPVTSMQATSTPGRTTASQTSPTSSTSTASSATSATSPATDATPVKKEEAKKQESPKAETKSESDTKPKLEAVKATPKVEPIPTPGKLSKERIAAMQKKFSGSDAGTVTPTDTVQPKPASTAEPITATNTGTMPISTPTSAATFKNLDQAFEANKQQPPFTSQNTGSAITPNKQNKAGNKVLNTNSLSTESTPSKPLTQVTPPSKEFKIVVDGITDHLTKKLGKAPATLSSGDSLKILEPPKGELNRNNKGNYNCSVATDSVENASSFFSAVLSGMVKAHGPIDVNLGGLQNLQTLEALARITVAQGCHINQPLPEDSQKLIKDNNMTVEQFLAHVKDKSKELTPPSSDEDPQNDSPSSKKPNR